jgi:DNA-binding IclR family transcriptional regulator
MGVAERDTKTLVLDVFKEAYSSDLNIAEVSKRAGVAPNTASTWIKVLSAEGILEESRRIGNAKMYRLRRR